MLEVGEGDTMRMIAGILAISGLAAYLGSAFTQHHVVIVMPCIVLAVLWGHGDLQLRTLEKETPSHTTGCLGLMAVLCALSTSVGSLSWFRVLSHSTPWLGSASHGPSNGPSTRCTVPS